MKTLMIIYFLFFACLRFISAQDWQTEEMAVHGSPVQICYSPTAAQRGLWNLEKDRLTAYIWTDILDRPKSFEMAFKDNAYRVSVTFNDTSVKMILFAFQRTDSEGRRHPMLGQQPTGEAFDPWDMLFSGEEGKPVQGAYLARAVSYMSEGRIRNVNLRKAEQAIEMELSLYPYNLAARRMKYAFLLKQHGADDAAFLAIRNDIRSVLRKMSDNKEALLFAYTSYQMIGEQGRAREIEKRLIELDPQGINAAQQRFGEIMDIRDWEKRAEALESFIETYQNTPLFETALAQLATAAIQLEDTTRMVDAGQMIMQHASSLISANGLAGLAGVFAENEFRLDLGLSFIQKSLDLMDIAHQFTPPMGMKDSEWKEELGIIEARFRDIHGLILLKLGHADLAAKELSQAAQTSSEPGIYYHYGLALENQMRYNEALVQYARGAAFEGDAGDAAFHALIDLWEKTGRDTLLIDSYVQNAVEWIENRFRKRVLGRRDVRPAPDFELEDLIRRNWVSLSDQEGTVVVLCFWATWSAASQQLLEDLTNIAHLYGEKVLFLTIATDPDSREIVQFLRRNRVIFPVLINDGTDEEYGLIGVPVLFVIDQNMRIHFEHRGYRPDMIQVLSVQLDDLLSKTE